MASTKAGSSSRALSLALERDESRWKPCCKRSSSRDESRDRSPRGALVIIAAKLPDGRQSGTWEFRPGILLGDRDSVHRCPSSAFPAGDRHRAANRPVIPLPWEAAQDCDVFACHYRLRFRQPEVQKQTN